ncbi:hypothetical protein HDU87_001916 [Geranomyces variabilis]|uniref:Uncharacterized protein n=1 Tax=Geranomyces variabilis TaxID=109894 RepID=A0AAD5TAT1_9FUNG|nr:hypothetical protein HDU87_001916 [Geranomyces variabilis]
MGASTGPQGNLTSSLHDTDLSVFHKSQLDEKNREIEDLRVKLLEASRNASIVHENPLGIVIVTTVVEHEMSSLREMVGSIHRWSQPNRDPQGPEIPHLVVYAFDLPEKFKHEISMWKNVVVLDAANTLFLGGRDVLSAYEKPRASDSYVRARVLEAQLEFFPAVLLVNNTVRFEEEALTKITHAIATNGYVFANANDHASELFVVGFAHGSPAFDSHVRHKLRCFHKYQCPRDFRDQVEAHQKTYADVAALAEIDLQEASDVGFFYCQILIRTDVLYTPFGELEQSVASNITNPTGKPFISLGMLTLTTSNIPRWEDAVPLTRFIASFFATVTEAEFDKYLFVIYIGFDEEDRFFDDSEILPEIDSHLKSLAGNRDVAFRFIRMPFTKGWVTYLWNGLFAFAIRDGADYFMQVNDDLDFTTPGWATLFAESIDANHGFGVTGPSDHGGELLTQALVGKIHYIIFGRLYPFNLKDWFSDNWLTKVYGPSNTFSLPVGMHHRPEQARYAPCSADEGRFLEILAHDIKLIAAWQANETNAEMLPLANPT